jgi:hypothetical protein
MATIPVGCGPPSQQAQTMTEHPTVIIVDDDPEIREGLGSLIRSVGVQAKALASFPEFLNEGRPDGPTCLVLDVRLPGRSGLGFQRELAAANIHVPDHLHHRTRRHPDVRPGDKERSDRVPDEAVSRSRPAGRIQLGLAQDRAWLENETAIAVLRARF